jgi:hypothetical protein
MTTGSLPSPGRLGPAEAAPLMAANPPITQSSAIQ